ncbi:MAG: acyl-CoA thioesterase [Chitinophagales bacterium]|nr:acyl-CoA thioesterase [Chitinophagales bacterium]
MYQDELKIRVRYGETDKMGQVYYGYYSLYYEQSRTEAIRKLGSTYKELEDSGILMPVTRMEVKFIKPASYDDMLTVKTTVPELPHKNIEFHHEIVNGEGDLINKAVIQLLFLSADKKKVVIIPDDLLNKLKPYFSNEQ